MWVHPTRLLPHCRRASTKFACATHLGRSRSEIKEGLPGERLKGVALDVGQAELDVERAVLQLTEHVVRRHELVALHAK